MSESIKVFENSLRDYLINSHFDSYNKVSKIEYKYNNLKFFMDPERNMTPHFWVSIGILAVCFSINPVEKIAGNIGIEDKFIMMWANRTNINGELRKHWEYLIKIAEREEREGEEQRLNNNEEEDEFSSASELITGPGSIDYKTYNKLPKKFKIRRMKLKPFKINILKVKKGIKS